MTKLALNQTVQQTIVEALAGGLSVADAASLAGVGRRTVYDWLRRGDMGEEPFATFLHAVNRARAESTQALIELARAQAADDPGQVRYLLGMRDPKRFGKDPEPSDPLREAWGDLTDEEAAEAMAKLPSVRKAVLAQVEAEKARKLAEGGEGE